MKPVTLYPLIPDSPAVIEDIQANHRQVAEAICDFESRQLPGDHVDFDQLTGFAAYAFEDADLEQTTLRSDLNTWAWQTNNSSGLHNPIDTAAPADVAEAGWIPVEDLAPNMDVQFVMPADPGILQGSVCLDSELRCSAANNRPTDRPYPNRDLWWEFAVFANGAKIAQGPRLYAGRHTITIPFMTFTGSEEVALDVRCRVYFGHQQYTGSTAIQREPLAFHSLHFYAHTTRF